MEVGSTHFEATLNFELTSPLISSMCVSLVSGCFHHATWSFLRKHIRVVKLAVIQGQIDELTHFFLEINLRV